MPGYRKENYAEDVGVPEYLVAVMKNLTHFWNESRDPKTICIIPSHLQSGRAFPIEKEQVV